MFQPGERRIQGFRSTHQLSPWLSDYGHAAFLPFCGEINPDFLETSQLSQTRGGHLRSALSSSAPGALWRRRRLIPTERCALIRASFAKPDVPGFLFDIPGEHPPDIHQDAVRRTISFTSTANSGGVPDNFATYYVLQFSEPWETFGMTELKNHSVGSCIFRPIPSHWMFASQPPLSPSNRRSTISIMSLAPALRKTFFNRGRTSGTTIFAA